MSKKLIISYPFLVRTTDSRTGRVTETREVEVVFGDNGIGLPHIHIEAADLNENQREYITSACMDSMLTAFVQVAASAEYVEATDPNAPVAVPNKY